MSGDAKSEDFTSDHNEKDMDEELDDEIPDAMLGGLRRGMITIRNNAKETLEKCKTDELRSEMEGLLRSSTIKLIRSEKSYLETAKIVSQVVDEISSDFEDDQDTAGVAKCQNADMETLETSKRSWKVFRPTFANSDSIVNTAKRMATLFEDRVKTFEDSLTEALLQNHPKFKALESQINLVETKDEKDSRIVMLKGDGDGEALQENSDLKSCSVFYDPEEPVDFYAIPSVDPISRQPIQFAVRNKYCNHIFEDMSIREFMALNPNSTCPMYGCLNKRKLEHSHLIFDPDLNDHIQEKHDACEYMLSREI